MEGTDRKRYQLILSEGRRCLVQHQEELRQVQQQLDEVRERAREVEQRLRRELQQMTREKEQTGERAREVEQRLTREKEELRQELQHSQQQIHQARERANEIEQRLTRENQRVVRENQRVTRENQRVTRENQQVTREMEDMVREKEQLQQEVQTANTNRAQSQEQIQQLRQQLSVMQISEGREEQPHWVVRREEVEVTQESVGRGGWGEVKVAKFRGLRVAAKYLYEVILSNYNRRLFSREMSIAAKLRHPNLLLFIGATREGEAIILTELMPTSLRRELERGEMSRAHITTVSQDIACALCYLHLWQPYPIIHRDISSGNVLLEPLVNGWRAKVSDYGSANFTNLVSTTVGPGNPLYAAPEACYPHQHSPKMDIFSFGVLLVEMCLQELPESRPELRQEQIQRIQWAAMVSLIKRCICVRPADRPSMSDIMEQLSQYRTMED